MNSIQEIVQEWNKLIGLFQTKTLNDAFEIDRLVRRIETAIELDPTNLTALMMIQNTLSDYLESQSLTLAQIIHDMPQFAEFVRTYRKIQTLLKNNEMYEQADHFVAAIKHSLKQANFFSPAVEEFVNETYNVAEIRLSALRAFKSLKVNQFSRGASRTEPARHLAFSENVFEVYDINMLLRMVSQPSIADGVYLFIVRNVSDERFSYFTFVIKSSGNIYLVSDKPHMPSPNYINVGRGRAIERRFEERIESNFFPYGLLNVKYDEELSKYVFERDTYQTAIQQFQPYWKVAGKLIDCEPAEILWVFMLYSLYQMKFFGEELPQLDSITYTAMMIEPHSQPGASTALAKVDGSIVTYDPLRFPDITLDTLNNENPEVAAAWKIKPTGDKQWLEDRYAPQVTDPNIIGVLAAPAENYSMTADNQIVPGTINDDFFRTMDRYKPSASDLPALNMSEFGSQKELKHLYIWFARKAQATAIQNLAYQEFQEKKVEVEKWYRQRVRENASALREAVAKGEMICKFRAVEIGGSFTPDSAIREKNILYLMLEKDYHNWHSYYMAQEINRQIRCYFTGKPASYVAMFDVEDVYAIARVCGCEIADLPIFLQHYYKRELYHGNSILDTIDPMESVQNPWLSLGLDVALFLSRSEYRAICKEYGQKPREIGKK